MGPQPQPSKTFTIIPLKANLSWSIIMKSKNWESFKGKKPWTSPTSSSTWLRRPEDSIWTTWSPILTWLRFFNNCLKSCNRMKPSTISSTNMIEIWLTSMEDQDITKTDRTSTKTEDKEVITAKTWVTWTNTSSRIWVDIKDKCQVHMVVLEDKDREWTRHHHQWTNQCQLSHLCQESLKETCNKCQEFHSNTLTNSRWPQNKSTCKLSQSSFHPSPRRTHTWRTKLVRPSSNSSTKWSSQREHQRLQVCLSNFQLIRSSSTCHLTLLLEPRYSKLPLSLTTQRNRDTSTPSNEKGEMKKNNL